MLKIIVNKNNTALLNVDNHEVTLQPEYRLDKTTKFNLYTIRSGKAISKVYAIPNKTQNVTLLPSGRKSHNGIIYTGLKSKNLIVKDTYIAIKGHTMKLS